MLAEWEEQVRLDWDSGAFDRVGEILFSAVDRKQLGYALASIALQIAKNRECVLEREFLAVVAEESSWPRACKLFDQLRAKTLRAEKNGDPNSRASLLLLFQENVAKHLCNLVSNLKRFDEDSGKWAVICLAHVLNCVDASSSTALRDLFMDTAMGRIAR